MKANTLAFSLILAAALWRIFCATHSALSNVAPITALAFCAAAYNRDRRFWLIPFTALALSDLWLNHYYSAHFGYSMTAPEILVRAASVATALVVGYIVASKRNVTTLLAGSLGSSLLFYLTTNTASWFNDIYYSHTIQGWWQALTIGRPEYPPTLWFFRNTLFGDLAFTCLFVFAEALVATKQSAISNKVAP